MPSYLLACHHLPFGYTKLKELDSFSYHKKSNILSPAYLGYEQEEEVLLNKKSHKIYFCFIFSTAIYLKADFIRGWFYICLRNVFIQDPIDLVQETSYVSLIKSYKNKFFTVNNFNFLLQFYLFLKNKQHHQQLCIYVYLLI